MRERLPTRRRGLSFNVDHAGHQFVATVSVFDDSRLAEIFLRPTSAENDLTAQVRDAAVLASIALQFGAPLDVLRHALTRTSGGRAPASPIGAALDAAAQLISERTIA